MNQIFVTPLRQGRRERGAVTLEMALTLGALLFISIGLITGYQLIFRHIVLQFAVSEGVRSASIGLSTAGVTREEFVVKQVISVAANHNVSLSPSDISICPATSVCGSVLDAGAPGDVVRVAVRQYVTIFSWRITTLLNAWALMRNEQHE